MYQILSHVEIERFVISFTVEREDENDDAISILMKQEMPKELGDDANLVYHDWNHCWVQRGREGPFLAIITCTFERVRRGEG